MCLIYYCVAVSLELLSAVVGGQNVVAIPENRPSQSQQHNLTFGVILPNNDKYASSIHRVLPVIKLAIDRVQADPALLPGWNIRVKWSKLLGDCSSTYGPLSAIEMRQDVQVFFGPVCDYDLAPVVRYTNASWGIPVLTSGGRNSVFDNKTEYALLTRMNGYYRQLGDIFLEILNKFHWKIVGMLFSDHLLHRNMGRSDYYFALNPVFDTLKEKRPGSKPPFYKSFDEAATIEEFATLLKEMVLHARIIVLCASRRSVRNLLLTADSLGMLESGDCVFIYVELTGGTSNSNEKIWFNELDTAENNSRARKAFESVLMLRPRTPYSDQYRHFSQEVAHLAVREYGFPQQDDEVSLEAASFYEAVILYVTALNDAIKLGYSPKDGRIIHGLMRNRTLPGIVGNFSVDGNNDRHGDFSILDMEPSTGLFREVAMYLGTDKRYVEAPSSTIHWSGGRLTPPPDEPECGFDNAKCISIIGTGEIIAIVLSVVLVVVLIMGALCYRHYKREAELASMTWLVKYEDLKFGKEGDLKRTDSRQSLFKNRDDVSMDTLAFGENRKQIFAQTAWYKKQLCAVKKMKCLQIPLSRPMLKEFKTIQGMTHDHVAAFRGACFDSEPPCLLFEYCPKGSLEDILENEEIQLDWMFRYSLMHDLVKGMAYIHSSELKTHGNLKSTNCVVDSRFVLKVTDYGPHCMRNIDGGDLDDETDAFPHWHRRLWTAPELLRLPKIPAAGTQKGDVYSFAIIAQEIVYRSGPFFIQHEEAHQTDDPKEIVLRVMMESRNGQVFRPSLDASAADESLVVIIEKCWSEDPNIRPDFHTLRNHIRRLNRVNESGNLLDNLLQRMEQYANNLETLVQERTADYLEQKRKAEELLYQLLPRAVASQLIRGEAVKAESFDSVTVYFSDIVGFTMISAMSTPLQVVNFLNDLYTCFDGITEVFDVYKVETIGDAYVVVSGLPVRNGNLHAREIGRMSLRIIEAVKTFTIRHRPDDSLRVRIGLHSGPVVAGVVGLKMPRYCLFGDTVNTASRMESNSLPLRIHCSEACKNVLETFGSFELELRGELDVKGKGKMTTYWLNGEKPDLSVIASPAQSPTTPTMVPTTGFFASSDLKRVSSKPRSLASAGMQAPAVPPIPVSHVEENEVSPASTRSILVDTSPDSNASAATPPSVQFLLSNGISMTSTAPSSAVPVQNGAGDFYA
ncbi:hypothetical protein RvY_03727 [Ramazzottius varieornatus]|uniref:Guanylate cyclase n=1 Tax=Ramazzottius varieornatus TaxID=947166 RepID=A0A1D1UW84_RAMVA|nr:hypothetical protein RvY_03727 [Ramazzottius varieornatus]